MTCYFPKTSALTHRLNGSEVTLVICFCAAWCDTCTTYQTKFATLAAQHPQACFIWIDIEDHPELLGDEDVENFPTIAIIRQSTVRFMGTILPHIEHLDRLIETYQVATETQHTRLPENFYTLLTR